MQRLMGLSLEAYPTVQIQERLRSTAWEARIAAGECLGHLSEHCMHHSAAALHQQVAAAAVHDADDTTDTKPAVDGSEVYHLSFRGFSAEAVLTRGTLLLASGGKVISSLSLDPVFKCMLTRSSNQTLG